MAPRSSYAESLSTAEKRKHQRLNIKAPASVKLKSGALFNGKTTNMSYNGVFVELNDVTEIKLGQHCILTVEVRDALNDMELKLKCKIKHANQHGIGLEIKDFYEDDYNDFVFMLANNSPDPEKFLAELSEHPDFQILWD